MFNYAQQPLEALHAAEYDEHHKCITSNAAKYSMAALNSVKTLEGCFVTVFLGPAIRTPDASSEMLIMMQNGHMEASMTAAEPTCASSCGEPGDLSERRRVHRGDTEKACVQCAF